VRTETPCLELYHNSCSLEDVSYVYAIRDEKRDCTKFGLSYVPGARLGSLRKKFGGHLELKATWPFPTWSDAYVIEQHVHSVIGSALRIGHYPSEWFRIASEGWDLIGNYLDRASDEMTIPGDANTWVQKRVKEAEEKEREEKEESERRRKEKKEAQKQRAELILQRLSEEEREELQRYFLMPLIDRFSDSA
jgi:hypothetical protein